MTDRELLELAAKAAGYWLAHDGMCATGVDTPFVQWNPLTDDGDALRLAVKLRFEIVPVDAGYVDVRKPGIEAFFCVCEKGLDQFAATRRAIVRAAAEIGKAM